MDLKLLFKKQLEKSRAEREKNHITEEDERKANEKLEDELFKEYYKKWKGVQPEDTDATYKVIPKFYFKIPKQNEILPQKLREETRALFLQRRSRALLDNNELKALWTLLEHNHSPPFNSDEQLINYVDFLKVAALAGTKCKPYFTATVFAKLQHGDPYGRISIMALFNYAMRKVWLHQTRIGLSLYDITGQGYLRESVSELLSIILDCQKKVNSFHILSCYALAKSILHFPHSHDRPKSQCQKVTLFLTSVHFLDLYYSLYERANKDSTGTEDLENYILELIPTLPQLEGLEKSFNSFYVCTAVRKFFFFLDPLRTGRIRIQDILACSFLDDLLELRDEDLPKDMQEQNWFSAPSALRVYGQYLNLDKDHNGMLNKDELAGYGTGTLTKVFLDRVFQECLTYDGEMDYKTYLDFVLALENRHEPQALHYFFKILDINSRGYLTTFELNYFFRAIQEQLISHGAEPVIFEDIKDEIFDMVKPIDSTRITLQDLISCGQGDTMVSILIEFHGFWAYENREAVAADVGADESHRV